MATRPVQPLQFPSPKKAFIRRFAPDHSQRTRHIVQGLFLLLNGWLGLQFYLWTRYFERGATGFRVPRPAGVEGWLPIAGLMNTKYLLLTGRVPQIHPAAMFLFIGFMLMSLLLKKAFCSWLCPVGTFSEFLWKLGRRIFGRNLRLPRWFDIPLRGLKYLLLGLFVAVIGVMSAAALEDFMATPYGLVADVKMLNFFRDLGLTAAVVIGSADVALYTGAELLVPLSLPLRRDHGTRVIIEPRKDPSRSGRLHRLRQVCQGMSRPTSPSTS